MGKTKICLIYENEDKGWEDYETRIIKAFFSKEDAKNFIIQKEKELELLKERYEYCSNCYCYSENKNCKHFELDSDFPEEGCINRVEYYEIEGFYYTMEEIEVE